MENKKVEPNNLFCETCKGRGVVFPKGYIDMDPNIIELSLKSPTIPLLKCKACKIIEIPKQ